jgi:tetratricopeptide (TPR) repeat protein
MSANEQPEGSIGARSNVESLPPELKSFAARQEARAKELAARHNADLPTVVWAYFDAAKQGNWPEISRLGDELRKLALPPGMPRPDPAVVSQVWAAITEIWMAAAQFALAEPAYAFAFGRGVIQSIPPGSIYFGGTDAGRGLVTVLCRSHETGDPFFTLTQNALADRTYLRYLREIYSGRISVLSDQDWQRAYDEYVTDFERRKKENQLGPGEWAESVAAEAIRKISSRGKQLRPGEMAERVDGKVQLTGQISVMAVNGAMARLIFDRNAGREFFVEESFPLEWMYPHLLPHGFILAIAREPLPAIPPERVEEDRRFWRGQLGQLLGDWLWPETPVAEICAFAERVFLRKDLTGFEGDPKYVANEHTCRAFSKLRSSIGGVYHWRAKVDPDTPDKPSMAEAADLAFRQAFALCPSSPEAVFRYASLLLAERRLAEALQLARTASKLDPENSQLRELAGHIRANGQEQ